MAGVVIIGGSFGGLTAALELRRLLGRKAGITVVSDTDVFTFMPSLPWIAMGWRKPKDITLDLNRILAGKGIAFLQAAVRMIDTEKQEVDTGASRLHYDYLVIATGAHLDFETIPGLGPEKGFTNSIMTLDHAMETNRAWNRYLEGGGPVVVGATQGVSCFGPAYEFVFGVDHVLRKLGKRKKTPLFFVTSEPFLSHFGLGGVGKARRMMEDEFAEKDIKAFTNATIKEISPGRVSLADGTGLPFALSLFVPPFRGVDAVVASGLGNAKGFIEVDKYFRHCAHPNVYAAGVAVALPPREATPVPTGVPKTAYMTEHMAMLAAFNIAADIRGADKRALPVDELDVTCIADLGDRAVLMVAKPALAPRQRIYLKKSRWALWLKKVFEKYFLLKVKRGLMHLPRILW
ncbi:MAG: FAD-dependent oxidoreductase [Peptococcaceae bacterium]|jgi:sulfide:quinone oxidoreductase|nr:FAD-dependent oxidoreductase [Peptococcaceae bacterium]